MVELKCVNCGSKDMMLHCGVWVCQACGSRFIAEKSQVCELENLHDDLMIALEDDDLEAVDRYVKKLLRKNNEDPYAWLGTIYINERFMRHDLYSDTVEECLNDFNRTIQYTEKYVNEDGQGEIMDALRDLIFSMKSYLLEMEDGEEHSLEIEDLIQKLVDY